jgi:hypothetical protein
MVVSCAFRVQQANTIPPHQLIESLSSKNTPVAEHDPGMRKIASATLSH